MIDLRLRLLDLSLRLRRKLLVAQVAVRLVGCREVQVAVAARERDARVELGSVGDRAKLLLHLGRELRHACPRQR